MGGLNQLIPVNGTETQIEGRPFDCIPASLNQLIPVNGTETATVEYIIIDPIMSQSINPGQRDWN